MISTNRLLLRQIKKEDQHFIQRYLADEELSKHLPLERPYTESESLKWFLGRIEHWSKNTFGTYIILNKECTQRLGYCGIEYVRDTEYVDIRYSLLKEYWGNGYAFEAALAVLKQGFNELCFRKLYGAAVPANIASVSLLKKLGMSEDTTFCVYGSEVAHYSVSSARYNEIIEEHSA